MHNEAAIRLGPVCPLHTPFPYPFILKEKFLDN
nr:MAG TPA: hypothetical protein [Caudoviricetes sp.]